MRIILSASLVVGLALAAAADERYIPDNIFANSCNVIPMNGGWPSTSNPNGEWRYQTQLNAAWIGRAGVITDMAFRCCKTGPILTAQQFQIRMSHTTFAAPQNNFNTNLPNPVTVFPSGNFTYTSTASQWVPFGLQAPFTYNGTDNLTIEIRYLTGTVAGGSLSCDTNSGHANAPYRTYRYGAGSYNAPTAATTGNRAGLKVRLTFADAAITASGSPGIGQTVTLQLNAPAETGKIYQVGTSLGTGPIKVDTRQLGLSLDDLLILAVKNLLPTVFVNYTNRLSASGQATATINIPANPGLVGVRLHSAFVVLDPNAPSFISAISNTDSFSITP